MKLIDKIDQIRNMFITNFIDWLIKYNYGSYNIIYKNI